MGKQMYRAARHTGSEMTGRTGEPGKENGSVMWPRECKPLSPEKCGRAFYTSTAWDSGCLVWIFKEGWYNDLKENGSQREWHY